MNKYLLCLTILIYSSNVLALEVQPGDYEMLPANKNLALLYYTNTQASKAYENNLSTDSSNLETNIGMARLIHAFAPKENIRIQPQIILPFGGLSSSGNASYLGKNSGVGDLILGSPILFTPNTMENNIFVFAPFITIPSGSYEKSKALNLGENRWDVILQTAWIYHFSDKFDIESIFDTTFFSKNKSFGIDSSTMSQDPKYEYQLYFRYSLNPSTSIGAGVGWINGSEMKIDGIEQNNKLNTTYGKLSMTHMFENNIQLNLSWGQDFKVENGFKQDSDLTLRVGYLF